MGLTIAKAALKWCGQDTAQESRPALTRMVRRLATEHRIMEETLILAKKALEEDDDSDEALVLIVACLTVVDP